MDTEEARLQAEILQRDAVILRQKRTLAHFEERQRGFTYVDRIIATNKQLVGRVERRENMISDLNQKLEKMKLQRDMAISRANDLINKQQMQGFKGIESARWTPREESQIEADLDNLKQKMKDVSKKFSVAAMPDPTDFATTFTAAEYSSTLRRVTWWNNEDNPLKELNSSKVSGVLLNALMANAVYVGLFGDAFAFAQDVKSPDNVLRDMYQHAIKGSLNFLVEICNYN
jgi:hypothetical protein